MAHTPSKKTLLLLDLASRLAKYIESQLTPERVTLQNLYSNVAPFVGDENFVITLIEEFLLPHFDVENKEFDVEGLHGLVPPKFKDNLGELGIPPEVEKKMGLYFEALCDVYTAV